MDQGLMINQYNDLKKAIPTYMNLLMKIPIVRKVLLIPITDKK